MEIYRRFIVTKIPKWFLSYSSQRVIFVFGVLCCALTIFFSSCTMYLKMFFFFYSGTSENGSTVFKTGNDIYDFSSDEQQCRFKERFRIHLVAQLQFFFSFFSCLCNICVFCSQRMKCLGFLIRFFFTFSCCSHFRFLVFLVKS